MRCPSVVLVALACTSALSIAPAWSASAATNGPGVLAPITLAELAGQWVADDWATSLEITRSPRAAAVVATAMAFTLELEGEAPPPSDHQLHEVALERAREKLRCRIDGRRLPREAHDPVRPSHGSGAPGVRCRIVGSEADALLGPNRV